MPIDKDLQQIVDVVAEGTQTLITQLKDGFQYTDIFAMIPVFSKIPEAIKDADNALHYLKDMTEEKENEIVDAVAAKLNDASENLKNGARRVLRLIAEGYMTAMFFSGLKGTSIPAHPPIN